LAAVDSYADVEVADSPRGRDIARVLPDDVANAKGGARGSLRVVLVRSRNAEVGADPIAHVRLNAAAVLLDGSAHHRHAFPDERLYLVGGEALSERGGPHDVREENGYGAKLVAGAVLVGGRAAGAALDE
jgi:hypothetical protein